MGTVSPVVISAVDPVMVELSSGLRSRTFARLAARLQREVVDCRPWGLYFVSRLLLVAPDWRTNPTMRQRAAVFGVSVATRVIEALVRRWRCIRGSGSLVNDHGRHTGTDRNHKVTAPSMNYRYSTNRQVVVDADTELVVALGQSSCKTGAMGEPLANLRRVIAVVRRITSPVPDGFGISAVAVSTVGLAPAIRKLADEDMSVRLAVSLHTPDDELRDTLVPVNKRWPIAAVLDAARYYADKSGQRVSIECALFVTSTTSLMSE